MNLGTPERHRLALVGGDLATNRTHVDYATHGTDPKLGPKRDQARGAEHVNLFVLEDDFESRPRLVVVAKTDVRCGGAQTIEQPRP